MKAFLAGLGKVLTEIVVWGAAHPQLVQEIVNVALQAKAADKTNG